MNADRQALIVIDLAFGDCGKGSIVDYLAREHSAHTVVRFNGGPQAGHNVVTPEGLHHTFSQFGSGTFLPGVRTLLSRFMLVEPYALLNEAERLRELGVPDANERLLIDERCPVITPVHQAANRLREFARGSLAHGTCGLGVGETMQDQIERPDQILRAQDLRDRATVIAKLHAARQMKLSELSELIDEWSYDARVQRFIDTLLDPSWMKVAADNYAELAARANVVDAASSRSLLRDRGTVIFEGAQGALLDESFGFHPHTTWSTTTAANADQLLDDASHDGLRTRVGVLRTYFTRHGLGPFVTEDNSLRPRLPEPHNTDAGWQGFFRVGAFDAVAARYALVAAGSVDWLALTHVDRVPALPKGVCTSYESDVEGLVPDLQRSPTLTELVHRCRPVYSPVNGGAPKDFVEFIARELGTRVGITSSGPTARDKRAAADFASR